MLNIVLVNPQIPPNTGNIGRLCVNIGARLHLISPLGFDISEKALRRAGLDYWKSVDLTVWDSLDEFVDSQPIGDRFHLATTKSQNPYWEARYSIGDYLMFGSESGGLPSDILERYPERTINIPMAPQGRSLNLSVSVGIVAYEALRQNYETVSKMWGENR